MTTTAVPITKNVEIKKQFTDDDKLKLLEQISDADKVIEAKETELSMLQESIKSLKEAIAGQYESMSDLCKKYRLGYESKWTPCRVVYENGIATFYDAKTAEKVDERPITNEEQLMLSENRIDAEDIIRADRESQDNENDEG